MNTLLHNLVDRSLQPPQGLRQLHPVYQGQRPAMVVPQLFRAVEQGGFGDRFAREVRDPGLDVAAPAAPHGETADASTPLEDHPASDISGDTATLHAPNDDSTASRLAAATHRRQARFGQPADSETLDAVGPQMVSATPSGGPFPAISTTVSRGAPPSRHTAGHAALLHQPEEAPACELQETSASSGRTDSQGTAACRNDNPGAAALPSSIVLERSSDRGLDVSHQHRNGSAPIGHDRIRVEFDETVASPKPHRPHDHIGTFFAEQPDGGCETLEHDVPSSPSGNGLTGRTVRPVMISVAVPGHSARGATAGSATESPAMAERHVTISIGKLELKVAGGRPKLEPAGRQPPPTSSLEEYLRVRTAGGGR